MHFVKLLIRVRKFVPYFVTFVKPLIELGIRSSFLNLNLQVYLDHCWLGSMTMQMTGNKELFFLVQVLVLQVRLEFHKVLSLDLSCFVYILMALLKTFTPLLDFLLMILACISLSMTPFRLLINSIRTW